MLFTDKARAETLMNTGCAVFGQDRTSVSCCFQVLPSHFSRDHPFDPILIPSQTIIQPKSTASQQYGIIIHISLWLYKPERWGTYVLSFSSLLLSTSLFVLVWRHSWRLQYRKGVAHISRIKNRPCRVSASSQENPLLTYHLPPPSSSQQPTMPDSTAGTTCALIRTGTILSPHTCITAYAEKHNAWRGMNTL